MPVYSIETTDTHADGKRKRIFVEAPHGALQTLAIDLRGGPTVVTQLFAKLDVECNNMVIYDRRDLMINGPLVHMAYLADKPFVNGPEIAGQPA